MGFHNAILPVKFIGYTSIIGPGHKTQVNESASGLEDNRVARWPQDRRRFEIVNKLGRDDAGELKDFIIARRGAVHSFLLQDLSDFSSNPDHAGATNGEDQTLGIGDGAQTEFQLKKAYVSGATTKTRIINKPVPGTVLITVNAAGRTEGIDYAIDYQSGRVSFNVAVIASDVVKAGFLFYNQVRFADSIDNVAFTWTAHDVVETEAGIIADRVATAAGDRHEAWTDNVVFGGGSAFRTSGTQQVFFENALGRVIEIFPFSSMDLRLPDVQEKESGRWSPYPVTQRVAAGGVYFVIHNSHPTNVITLKERVDPGGGFVWRDLLSGSVVGPTGFREVFLDVSGLWRGR